MKKKMTTTFISEKAVVQSGLPYKVVESVFMKENNSRENKVKFRNCEKATKFEKNLPLVLTFKQ